jgi:hypothetical protein
MAEYSILYFLSYIFYLLTRNKERVKWEDNGDLLFYILCIMYIMYKLLLCILIMQYTFFDGFCNMYCMLQSWSLCGRLFWQRGSEETVSTQWFCIQATVFRRIIAVVVRRQDEGELNVLCTPPAHHI